MKHDSTQLSSVNTRSFQDAQEWKIYKHVECTHEITNVEYASSTIHPILMFQCRVRRKVWYFIWNIVLIAVSRGSSSLHIEKMVMVYLSVCSYW